jgi:hypothetical protein
LAGDYLGDAFEMLWAKLPADERACYVPAVGSTPTLVDAWRSAKDDERRQFCGDNAAQLRAVIQSVQSPRGIDPVVAALAEYRKLEPGQRDKFAQESGIASLHGRQPAESVNSARPKNINLIGELTTFARSCTHLPTVNLLKKIELELTR